MDDKEKPVIEQAADKINDVVEEITLKAADAAIEPDAEHVAGTTNEQVHVPEATENVSLPSHIDPKSDDRTARERQKYVEQIVGMAAAPPKKVAKKTETIARRMSKKKKAKR
ncbi:hypothetical protein [Bradyrhizobium sp. URHD0069]|uniref:hypothetical protein n=1 Tax=Bradyrhizobium sp. URHD0069 TaxID=1380355 RepID=UPI0012DE6E81|nr:hypothetical protein [Bradyrhizobium sp. URHD0069]